MGGALTAARMSSLAGTRMRRKARSMAPRAAEIDGTTTPMRAVGLSSKRSRAQASAGFDLLAQIGGGDPALLLRRNRRRLGFKSRDGHAPRPNHIEQFALRRSQAVEANQQDGSGEHDVRRIGEMRKQRRFQLTRTLPPMARAELIEGSRPMAKALGIGLIPCRATGGMRLIRGQQRPGVHGQSGHRVR